MLNHWLNTIVCADLLHFPFFWACFMNFPRFRACKWCLFLRDGIVLLSFLEPRVTVQEILIIFFFRKVRIVYSWMLGMVFTWSKLVLVGLFPMSSAIVSVSPQIPAKFWTEDNPLFLMNDSLPHLYQFRSVSITAVIIPYLKWLLKIEWSAYLKLFH